MSTISTLHSVEIVGKCVDVNMGPNFHIVASLKLTLQMVFFLTSQFLIYSPEIYIFFIRMFGSSYFKT